MTVRRLLTPLLTLALILGVAGPVAASHFRASYGGVTYSSGTLTWTVASAWRRDNTDHFFDDVDVTLGGSPVNDAPVTVTEGSLDISNPLYGVAEDTVTVDIGNRLDDPGTYQVYGTECCRIDGVVNTNGENDFSQSFTFTVNGDSSVNLPPAFDAPALYTLIPTTDPNGVTLDYSATDPTAEIVGYSQLTGATAPDWGGGALACSALTGALFELKPSLCTGGDVFSAIYTPGATFALKIRATDASGNWAETDTLLRVPAVPEPEIVDIVFDAGTAVVSVIANDEVPTGYSVTCTAAADPSDVHTVASSTSPVTVTGLQGGRVYNCVPSATNGAGTGTGSAEPLRSLTSTGIGTAPQTGTVIIPSDGNVTLLDSSNNPTTSVTVAGQGTYVLDSGTGVITFTPIAGFVGAATPVRYRTTDDDDRTQTSTYTPTVTAVSTDAQVSAPTLVKNAYRLPATCSFDSGLVSRCVVDAFATVNGRRVKVGTGVVTVSGGEETVSVPVILNKVGRSLAARPRGVAVALVASVMPSGSGTASVARTTSRVVAPTVTLRSIYFATDSATIGAADLKYLRDVRTRVQGVRSVTCIGHADVRSGATYNLALAKRRAAAVCSVLTKGTRITATLVSMGEREAVGSDGRSRRVDPTLIY